MNNVCFNPITLVVLIIITSIVFVSQYYAISELKIKVSSQHNNQQPNVIVEKVIDQMPIGDPVKDYDNRKLYDQLEEPTKRPSRYQLPPSHLKRLIDIPTSGYPDNFRQFGYLTSQSEGDAENKIIKLFGRRKHPGSDHYEYYVSVNSGLDKIKIPIEPKQQELYSDDVVTVGPLGKDYKVNIYENDSPRYYPDIF
jgi:hypothetical protein